MGILFIGYFGAAAASSRRMFSRVYKCSVHPRNRLRLRSLTIGAYIGYLAAMDFVPSLGIPLSPVGFLPIAAYLFTTSWVIVRYRLVDITPEIAANRILETMQGAVIVVDLEGKMRVVNRVAQEMLGHQKSELLGRDLASILTFPAAFCDTVRAGERTASHEMVWPGSHGQQFTVSVSASPLTADRKDSPVGMVCVAQDITERKQMEQRLKQLALYDALTGLPNRTLFFDRMNQLLALAKRNGYVLALLYMDLNRFKEINDTLGHDMGDMLLVEAGKRMVSCTRKADTVARMGGDEFIGICGRIAAPQDAGVVAEKILAILSEPFHLKKHVCTISASIGISIYPQDGDDLEMLVNKADAAMYCVKKSGKHGYAYSSPV
jgi:diguanylate cyclase (GGDEF)-like protein/PAS domain S-box-containing protein